MIFGKWQGCKMGGIKSAFRTKIVLCPRRARRNVRTAQRNRGLPANAIRLANDPM